MPIWTLKKKLFLGLGVFALVGSFAILGVTVLRIQNMKSTVGLPQAGGSCPTPDPGRIYLHKYSNDYTFNFAYTGSPLTDIQLSGIFCTYLGAGGSGSSYYYSASCPNLYGSTKTFTLSGDTNGTHCVWDITLDLSGVRMLYPALRSSSGGSTTPNCGANQIIVNGVCQDNYGCPAAEKPCATSVCNTTTGVWGACGGGTSGAASAGNCTYPELCTYNGVAGGGVHVCHGTMQQGTCKWDSSGRVAPNCTTCTSNSSAAAANPAPAAAAPSDSGTSAAPAAAAPAAYSPAQQNSGSSSPYYLASYPTGGVTTYSLTPTFTWFADTTGISYNNICIGTNSSCNGLACNWTPSTSDRSYTLPASANLLPNTNYYWVLYGQPGNPAPGTGCQAFRTPAAAAPVAHFGCVGGACASINGAGSNTDGCSAVGGYCCTALPDSCGTGQVCDTTTIPNSCKTASPTTHLGCQGTACATLAGAGANTDGCVIIGQSCGTGSACNATNCPSGCCSGNTCLSGGTSTACGVAGAVCSTCVTGQVCSSGQCISTVVQTQADSCWGNAGGDGKCYDCNGDGVVNVLDFSCFSKIYGKTVNL